MCVKKLIAGTTAADVCRNTAPGLDTRIYAARTEWLTGGAIPAREDFFTDDVANSPMLISTDITFDTVTYPEAGWYAIDAQVQTASLESTFEGNPGAKYRATNLSYNIAGLDAKLEQHVEWLERHDDLIFLVKDKSGAFRVVGDQNTPARVETSTFRTGAAPGDDIGFEMGIIVDAHNNLWPRYTGARTPLVTA